MYCSTVCGNQSKRRAAYRRDAKAAGEPLDSVRLSSAGARIEATAMKRADVEAAVAALQSR